MQLIYILFSNRSNFDGVCFHGRPVFSWHAVKSKIYSMHFILRIERDASGYLAHLRTSLHLPRAVFVGIHVRRTDYVNHLNFFGGEMVDETFFFKAVARMREMLDNNPNVSISGRRGNSRKFFIKKKSQYFREQKSHNYHGGKNISCR